MKLLWFLAFASALQVCAGGKILAMVPMPSRSHHNLFEGILGELAKRGHEVTYISAFKCKPVKNLKQIIVPNLQPNLTSSMGLNSNENEKEWNLFERRQLPNWLSTILRTKLGFTLTNLFLSLPEVQELINGNEKFDLIFGEIFLDESILAGFSHKFKAPIIIVSPFMPNIWANYVVGNVAPYAYVPDSLHGYTSQMTFVERVQNTLFGVFQEILHDFYYIPGQGEVMKKFFGSDSPPIKEIIKNTSLVLVNHHFSLAFPRPYVPNMVEIGGYHIAPPKPLPDDLQKYFDESKNGVILFSMGSNLKSSQMSDETKKAIIKAFSRLKEDVLWKFEDDTLTDLPKNVKIEKWLPQSDILAHPNLRLFITHGGLLSTTEAVFRGVPVVGIPIFGDQPTNMKYTTAAGFGVTLHFEDLNEENLYNAITEVLNTPKYKEKVKERSVLIQDTPLPALDTAIYWIEYVLRHKGAPHLRSAAQDLQWYQLYLLDVLGAIFIVSALTIFVIYYCTKLLLKILIGLFSKKSVSKKKNE